MCSEMKYQSLISTKERPEGSTFIRQDFADLKAHMDTVGFHQEKAAFESLAEKIKYQMLMKGKEWLDSLPPQTFLISGNVIEYHLRATIK